MPKFSQFISSDPRDLGGPLIISGIKVANEFGSLNPRYVYNYDNQDPFFTSGSGISQLDINNGNVSVHSGEFYSAEPEIQWSVVRPDTNEIVSPNDLLQIRSFSGFDVRIADSTGAVMMRLQTGDYKGLNSVIPDAFFSEYDIASGAFIDDFRFQQTNRSFRFEVVSRDFYGRTNTGILALSCPPPAIADVDVTVGRNITFEISGTKTSGLNSVDVYKFSGSGITDRGGVLTSDYSGLFEYNQSYTYDLPEGYLEPVTFPSDTQSGCFYGVKISDSIGYGPLYILPSSIKGVSVDPLLNNPTISGLEGKIVVERDNFNKLVKTNFVGKIMRDMDPDSSYEVNIVESGGFF